MTGSNRHFGLGGLVVEVDEVFDTIRKSTSISVLIDTWLMFARKLKIGDAKLAEIKESQKSITEKIYDVLIAWVAAHSKKATLDRLCTILTEEGLKHIAEELQEKFPINGPLNSNLAADHSSDAGSSPQHTDYNNGAQYEQESAALLSIQTNNNQSQGTCPEQCIVLVEGEPRTSCPKDVRRRICRCRCRWSYVVMSVLVLVTVPVFVLYLEKLSKRSDANANVIQANAVTRNPYNLSAKGQLLHGVGSYAVNSEYDE